MECNLYGKALVLPGLLCEIGGADSESSTEIPQTRKKLGEQQFGSHPTV